MDANLKLAQKRLTDRLIKGETLEGDDFRLLNILNSNNDLYINRMLEDIPDLYVRATNIIK